MANQKKRRQTEELSQSDTVKRRNRSKNSPESADNFSVDNNNNNSSKSMISNNVLDAKLSTTTASPSIKSRAIFILENASLEKGLVRKKRKILSAGEDADFLTKQGKNMSDSRPDIIHEALRGILDSPLNQAGLVGAVYVRTDSGVLFEVKPHTRIPRTCKRFCGVMLELLEKSCVRAKDTGDVLAQVLKKPLTHYLPENSHVIGLSYSSQKVVDIEEYLSAAIDDLNLVFVVGAMVNGKVSKDGKNDYISVSEYPLSSKCCIGLICEALEQKWNIY